jgi:hypothetical protein
MTGITITEALAEIKTIGKRIGKKRNYIAQHLARQEIVRDPLESAGGSRKVIAAERQAVDDLEARVVELRRGISLANDNTHVTINGTSRSISEWLTWRRDVAPGRKAWLESVQQALKSMRDDVARKGGTVSVGTLTRTDGEPKSSDVVVNVDEHALATEIEQLEDTLGQLDGQLSLKNATVTLDLVVPAALPSV